MQSKKRLTEINIWEAAWYMNLNVHEKLFERYLKHRCDNIGVWDPNFKLAAFHLDYQDDFQSLADGFFKKINYDRERIKLLKTGEWFIIDFVRFQYCRKKNLKRGNPAHRSYLDLMMERGLWEWFCENQPDVMPTEDIANFNEINPVPTLKKGAKRGLKEDSKGYKDKDTEKESDKEAETDKDTDLDKDTPVSIRKKEFKETPTEFEMRNKGMLDDTPFK